MANVQLSGRSGPWMEGVVELRKVLRSHVKPSDELTATNSPWVLESEPMPNLAPPALFRAVLTGSMLNKTFSQQNDAVDFRQGEWEHPAGRMWGGQRSSTMKISAGPLGMKAYQEQEQYVCAKESAGVTLVWWRCGKITESSLMIPDIRNEVLHLFRWRNGVLTVNTRGGMTGDVGGLMRGSIVATCKEAFYKQQPRFHSLVRAALVAAKPSPVVKPQTNTVNSRAAVVRKEAVIKKMPVAVKVSA